MDFNTAVDDTRNEANLMLPECSSILNRFCDMGCANGLGGGEIGDGSRYF